MASTSMLSSCTTSALIRPSVRPADSCDWLVGGVGEKEWQRSCLHRNQACHSNTPALLAHSQHLQDMHCAVQLQPCPNALST